MITRAHIHPADCACSRCHPRHPAEPRIAPKIAAVLLAQLARAARFTRRPVN